MALSEADVKAKFIDPHIHKCKWHENDVIREYPIVDDRFYVEGEEYKKLNTKKFADYVLNYKGIICAVIEAKKQGEDPEKHLSQAQDYAKRLDVPFAYIANDKSILLYDKRTKKTKSVKDYLPPADIYKAYIEWKGLEKCSKNPFEIEGHIGNKKPRAYQETAIRRVIENMVRGNQKTLLTMATGTGKTFMAFNIIWKLVKSKHFSRVLFLADRVLLRDQAYEEFEGFRKGSIDDRCKIENGQFNKNRNIYFSTYQTLFANNLYKKIPADFFDLIIIDECHRSRYGDWGTILDHFANAYHLGMTATPKREDNIDVYKYFGDPVFEYSLGQAIEDGYLVPYKIYKVTTNLDKKGVDISEAEEVLYDDEIEPDEIKDFYTSNEFERSVTLPDLTGYYCKKVIDILDKTDPFGKSIIFCEDMMHAQQVKDKFNELKNKEEYAARIVAEDKDDLTKFRDKEMPMPVIATTVDLLSTGVDIPHVKNIVFMRPIASKVLFKQIIGRGSRLCDNKGFFRIIDFKNVTRLIDEWDIPDKPEPEGEEPMPEEPFNKFLLGVVTSKGDERPISGAEIKVNVGRWGKSDFSNKDGSFKIFGLPSNDSVKVKVYKDGYRKITKRVRPQSKEDETPYEFKLKLQQSKPQKIKVMGIEVSIEDEVEIEFDGQKLSFAEYKKHFKSEIKKRVLNTKELKEIWINPEKKREFIEELKDKRLNIDLIKTIENLEDSDSFDVVAHLIFNAPLITREDRVKMFMRENKEGIEQFSKELQQVVFGLLDKYKYSGEENLTSEVFELPGMSAKKKIIESRYSKGLAGFLTFMKVKVYDKVIA